MSKRKTSELEQEVFGYLNALRESGAVNMFGASPHVESEFGLDKNKARKLTMLWMKVFDDEGNYDEIVDGGEPITDEAIA